MDCLPEDQRDELEALQAIYQPYELTISGVDETGEKYSNSEEKCVKIVARVIPFEEQDLETENQRAAQLTVTWFQDYPNTLPSIEVAGCDTASPLDNEKAAAAVTQLQQCGEEFLGMSMTSSLVEMLRENLEAWEFPSPLDKQDEKPAVSLWQEAQNRGSGSLETKSESSKADADSHSGVAPGDKMTKTQKRKYHDKFGVNKGQYRGWNWVDVISHLRKIGNSN